MENTRKSMHGQWTSSWGFILAATGSAVGLGNIWKFPYITGENGGGAFVLVYLICLAVIGIPVMMCEILIGRRGRQNPADAVMNVAEESSRSRHWGWVGGMGIIAGFLILSYYSVIAGWAVDYVWLGLTGTFSEATPDQVNGFFDALMGNYWLLLLWHSVFMIATIYVVARGVQKGLEKTVKLLLPIMMILMAVLLGYAINLGHFMDGVNFLFTPDFSAISANGVLIAMGHAFFTLSLGMGAIMVYGAYLPKNVSITKATLFIAGADTLIALLAGLVIFPIVFAYGLEPGAGPGLIFKTLPLAFGNMPGGSFFAVLFFIVLVFTAFTSAISLLEPAVAWLMEKTCVTRIRASVFLGFCTWLLGIGTILSFNVAADVKLFSLNFFELIDFLTANIMLPLGGLFIAIFVGWRMKRAGVLDELGFSEGWFHKIWRFILRYISTLAIITIFICTVCFT